MNILIYLGIAFLFGIYVSWIITSNYYEKKGKK